MNHLRKITASFGILLAVLLAGPAAFAQTTSTWTFNTLSPTFTTTAASANLVMASGKYIVGQLVTLPAAGGIAAGTYYIVSVGGTGNLTITVSGSPGGTALAATSTTTGNTATYKYDWTDSTQWSAGAPNSSSLLANFGSDSGVGVSVSGNQTTYGITWSGAGSTDLKFDGGGNGTSVGGLTFATSDATTPVVTMNGAGTVYTIMFGNIKQINLAGSQGLIFRSGVGTVTGSGLAATATDPTKNIRLYNATWTGFGGAVTIDRGTLQIQNANQLPTTLDLTVGGSFSSANSVPAELSLNGSLAQTVGNLNGNAWGRIRSGGTLTVGNNNATGGNYGGIIGQDMSGAVGVVNLSKTGTGTQTISGLIKGTGTVAVGGGTLILSGANSYSGATTVTAGELVVSSVQTGTGAFTISSGATLDVTASGTSQLKPSTLTMNSGATTLDFDNLAGTASAPLNPGTMALNGTVTVNINSGTLAPGNTYPLITWTTISGTGGFVLGNCPFKATLSTNSSTLQLNIATATTNVWTGVSNGNWDTNTTGNWTGGTGIYADGGVALFNDTASGTTTVAVNQALVKPGLALFNNSNLTYSVTAITGTNIGGAGSVSVSGGGKVTLTGPNTYTGGTTLSAGQLNLNYGGSSSANSAIGTGPFTISGGALDNTSSGDVSLAPAIVQNWNGDFAYVGSVHNLNLGNGAVTLGAHRQVAVTNNALTVGGVIGDGGAGYTLTKTGAGTLVLSNANTFSGGTTLSAGTIQAGSSSALGTGPSQLGAGVLDLNGNSLANSNNINNGSFVLTNSSASAGAWAANSKVNNNFTIGVGTGSISVARLIDYGSPLTVTKVGAGTLTFNGAGYNNLMGVTVNGGTALFANTTATTADRGVTLNAGTIKLNAVGGGSGNNAQLINTTQPFTVNGGTFDLNGWNETVSTIGGTGGVILNNAAGTTNTLSVGPDNPTGPVFYTNNYYGNLQNGSGVLALTKVGSGTQTLSGTNTYTGGTIITNAGMLQAGNPNVFPTAGGDMTVISGTLDLNGFNNAINGLNGAGTVDNVTNTGAATLTVGYNGDSGNFSGTIQNSAGTLSLTKVGAGAQILSGTSSYNGSTTISNGTLVIGSSLSGSGAVTVYGPGVLNASNSVSIAGPVSLVGTNATFSLLDGNIGTLTLSGNLTLTSSNVLKFDISGTIYPYLDAISIGGIFAQSGKAIININSVDAPNAGTYPLISGAAGISANNFVLGNALPGYTLSLSNDTANLYLVVGLNAPTSAYWHNYVGTAWNGHAGITYNWDTDQGSGINANALPSSPSDVYFAASGASNFNTTLGTDFIIKSLTFMVASNVTIAGTNTLTLNGAITVNSGAGTNTISVTNVVLGVDQNINVADAGNTLKIIAPISGAHAFNVNAAGAGTVALFGSSTYTGNTTVSGGTLALNNPTNTLPDGGAVNINNGATLSLGTNNGTVGAITLTSGNITGSSGVLKGSSYNLQSGTVSASLGGPAAMTVNGGSVLLAGNSTYSGGTTISSGTLQLGASNALGSGSVTIGANILDLNGQTIPNLINFNGAGTLENNGGTAAAVTTDANVTSSFTIDTTGGNITTARLIGTSATRTVTVIGGNTLTFNGAGHNNLVDLVVNAGTVICANNGGYSADRGLQIGNGGTVKLAGPGSGGAYPNSNLINDGQAFDVDGIFDLNGWNETVGTMVDTGGNGVIQNSAVGTNSTLTVGGDNVTATFNGTVQNGGGVLSLAKTGTGVQTLSGASTYSGSTTINNGQLAVAASGASPSSTFVVNTNSGLTFVTDSAFLLGGLSGTGNVSLLNDSSSAIALTAGANNASTTYSGALLDGGAGSTLTKVGTGTLTLSGTNNYSGFTTVSNGTVIISPNYIAGYNFTVNEGAVLGVSANTVSTSAQIGTLTPGISGAGTSTLLFTGLPVPTNAPLTVGTLTPAGGANSVLISSTATLAVGTYNLINYTTLAGGGFGAFTVGSLPAGTAAHLLNNTAATPNVIQLVVTAVAPQIWSGAVNTNWDIATTANWKLNGVSTNYHDLSPVLFDDTVGGGYTTVSLVTNVQPSSVTVSNNAKNFTFTTSSGSGINGATGLTKNGTGTLTLVNLTNNLSGSVTINAGAVVLASVSFGSNNITDNASLVFSNGAQLVSSVISGSGSVTQTGSGSVELAGLNAYSGGTVIKNGTVQTDNTNALGTGTVTLGDGASANNATLQAVPSTSFANTNPVVVAAGGSGSYSVQASGSGDYTVGGNVALNSAVTLRTTANGALWIAGVVTSGAGNPAVTVDGGNTTTKFVSFTADNSTTFAGSLVITNKGDFKAGNTNALSVTNTVFVDSTSTFDNGSRNVAIAGLNDFGGSGGTVADAGAGVNLTLGGVGSYSFAGVINNVGGIIKTGSGQQTLSGANVNSGPTVVSNGTLIVNGSLAGGAVTVAGGTLTGSGVLTGATIVQSGGTLSSGGTGIGTLTVSNNLTLAGNALVKLNKPLSPAQSNDVVKATGVLTYGGTLTVTNIGASSLVAGDAFNLFTAGTYAGAFANITPATPGAGLAWNTNTLTTDGTLRVASASASLSGLAFTAGPVISGTTLTISATNTGAGTVYLLTSTNAAAPVNTWTPIWTNVLGGTGSFTTNLPNAVNPALNQQFYLLSNTNN